VIFDDELKEMAKEIVRCDALGRVLIGLDYFDASINRVAAWVSGIRSVQKALLYALLLPHETLRELQDNGDFTRLMVMNEELKCYPFAEVWENFCEEHKVPVREEWLAVAEQYEKEVLFGRQ
jgi:L-rhamnose isomerase